MLSSRPIRILALLGVAACASSNVGSEPPPPRGDSRMITAAELATATQLNLYDYVQATRPLWLRQQARSSPVVVFVDDARLGGPATLRSVTLTTVSAVRYYDASAAQQKFNGRDLGPVIHVISK
ncbi:MAG: hypothetical protein ACJ8AD_02910 [Gemmatimonadaceae bacterium]